MEKKILTQKILLPIMILIILWQAFPLPVRAAISVISVSPTIVSNTQSNYITVSGTDFQSGAIVSLATFGNLVTTYFSSTTLFAEVPAGILSGEYSIVVTNPDTTAATLSNGLTVVDQVLSPTPTITASLVGYERPVIVVLSYVTSSERIIPGVSFSVNVTLYNAGQRYATNVMCAFSTGTLIPSGTGGVIAVGEIAPGNRATISQPLIVSTDFWGSLATGDMLVTYTDQDGVQYTERFTLSIPVYHSYSLASTQTPTPTATLTSTPAPAHRPQLVIPQYSTDLLTLQPGDQFTLSLTISNTGNTAARRITMIVGGGSASSSGYGTPDPSGISGASGEFTNFAPIGSSNIQTIGDLNPGESHNTSQTLIVNVSTNPGAYPMKISFVYVDEFNNPYVDEQVVTLLVYRIPNVDINFYQDPGPLFTGQPNILPLQIVNLGRSGAVFGNMQINTVGGQMSNNTILVGYLETGGYYTLDAIFIPDTPGTYDLVVSVDYLNDFNQAQVINKTITVEVLDMEFTEPEVEGFPGGEEFPSIEQPETFFQKLWRFILGFLGLDSALRSDNSMLTPAYEESTNEEFQPIQVEEIRPVPLKGP